MSCTSQLEEETQVKTERRLQMPPVMKPREDVSEALSDDSEIDGFDTHKIVFTDITTRIPHKVKKKPLKFHVSMMDEPMHNVIPGTSW